MRPSADPSNSGNVYCVACEASHEPPVAVAVNDYCPTYEKRVLTHPDVQRGFRDAFDEIERLRNG